MRCWITKEISNLETDLAIFAVTAKDRVETSTSSKGNQVKWCKNGKWLKSDFLGYEGLSEILSSWVALYTNLADFSPITHYYQCNVVEDSTTHIGCYSNSFLDESELCVTVGRLLVLKHGIGMDKRLDKMSTTDRIRTVVSIVEGLGLSNFGKWLTCLLEFDYLILNEDRHLFNIAVIQTPNGYRLMQASNSRHLEYGEKRCYT